MLVLTSTDGSASSVSVDPCTGRINSYTVNGEEILAAPLHPCFYRAPTDNDRGGSGGTSYAARWKSAGLDRLATQPGSCHIEVDGDGDGKQILKMKWRMVPQEVAAGSAAEVAVVEGVGVGEVGGMHWLSETTPTTEEEGGGGGGDVQQQLTGSEEGCIDVAVKLQLMVGGALEMHWEIDASHALPAVLPPRLKKSLPRIGIHFGVLNSRSSFTMKSSEDGEDGDDDGGGDVSDKTEASAAVVQCEWYGRGPHECYADRKAGAPLRWHSTHTHTGVDDLHVPYVFPTESGGRCDVRWAALYEEEENGETRKGVALAARNGASFQFSANRCGVDAFERARHDHELCAARDEFIHVHVDAVHMGVGGDDSWSPTVHGDFLVPPGVYAFSLGVAPLGIDGTRRQGSGGGVAQCAEDLWLKK